MASLKDHKIGWIGTGRMGYAMAERLLKAGADVSVWNRTRSKAEPLTEHGATVVDNIQDLADRDIVFTIVSGPNDFIEVALGEKGVLKGGGKLPKLLIDCSTISEEASHTVRQEAAKLGVTMLDACVSGNDKAVTGGALSVVSSGDKDAFDIAEPYLQALGRSVDYVGEGENARIVKICHNVFLGIVAQTMAEITVLAEKNGVPRHSFLNFINNSVMGSTFTKYKTPAYVNLDMTTTFTPVLLRKDMDLGLAAARDLGVPMPVSAAARETVQTLIGNGYVDCDFAALIKLQAANSGLEIEPEDVEVGTGL